MICDICRNALSFYIVDDCRTLSGRGMSRNRRHTTRWQPGGTVETWLVPKHPKEQAVLEPKEDERTKEVVCSDKKQTNKTNSYTYI